MNTTEFSPRTTARTAAFGHGGDDNLVAAMVARLPQGGVVATKVTDQPELPQSGYRVLDNRVLATALRFLDQNLAEPFLNGLSKYRALVQAARDTLAEPEQTEVMVTLIDPHEITSMQHPYVALVVDEQEIARVPFELSMVFNLMETAVAVRRGAIELVRCETCSLAVALSLPGWEEPLLHRKIQLSVQLPVQPPITIPLPGGA